MISTLAPRSRSLLMVGRLARMRPSSVIVAPSSGTLRSARSSTTRPATWSESRPFTSEYLSRAGGKAGADQRGKVSEPVGVTPLVVVPADDLDLVARRHRQLRVERAGIRRADDVGGHDRVRGVLQVALERPVGRCPVGRVDLLDAGFPLQL